MYFFRYFYFHFLLWFFDKSDDIYHTYIMALCYCFPCVSFMSSIFLHFLTHFNILCVAKSVFVLVYVSSSLSIVYQNHRYKSILSWFPFFAQTLYATLLYLHIFISRHFCWIVAIKPNGMKKRILIKNMRTQLLFVMLFCYGISYHTCTHFI